MILFNLPEYFGYGTLAGAAIVSATLFGYAFTFFKSETVRYLTQFLYCYAGGLYLANALSHLLPEALEHEPQFAGVFCTAGVLLFYALDHFNHRLRFFYARSAENAHNEAVVYLAVLSDGLHNFVDGVIIALAFLHGREAGILAALAVFAHEIPQELSKWGLFLSQKLTIKRILFYQLACGAMIFPGLWLGLFLGDALKDITSLLIALVAGNFLFLSIGKLLPHIHFEERRDYWRAFAVLAGVVSVMALARISAH